LAVRGARRVSLSPTPTLDADADDRRSHGNLPASLEPPCCTRTHLDTIILCSTRSQHARTNNTERLSRRKLLLSLSVVPDSKKQRATMPAVSLATCMQILRAAAPRAVPHRSGERARCLMLETENP